MASQNFYKRRIFIPAARAWLKQVKGRLVYAFSLRCRDKNSSTAFPLQHHVIIYLLLTAYCLLFTVGGCGYTIHNKASLPFREIRIGKIENKTLEPKLQDRLYRALTEEFLKQGVDVNSGAGYKISGTIHQFDLRILSEKSDVAVDYEVIVKADFILTDPSGKTREFRDIQSPFIVSFSGPGPLNDLIASKEVVSEQAIRDMAMEIVAGLIYR